MRHVVGASLSAMMVALCCPSIAIAQTAPPAARPETADANAEEIVVTANKRAEKLSDVPTAVAVLSGKSLEKSGATQFSQYFDKVPGISAVPAGQPGHAIVSIRGISTGASQTSPTIGSYINDVPFGGAGALAIAGQFVADPNTFDVDRIEVLRGPQGTLYGASTLGGLIKTVYASPVLNETQGRIMLGASTVEHGDTGYVANAMINLPAGQDFAVRAVVSQRRDPGFTDSVSPGNVRSDSNWANAFGARLGMLYRPAGPFSAELLALYQNTKAHGWNFVDVDPLTLAPQVGDLKTARTSLQPTSQLRYQLYSAKLEYDLNFAKLTSVTGYGLYHENKYQDVTFQVNVAPLVDKKQNLKTDNLTQEFRLTSPDGQMLEWMLGGFYARQDTDWLITQRGFSRTTFQPLVPPYEYYTFLGDVKYVEKAVFANSTLNFTPKFSVSGGVRYSRNRQDFTFTRSGVINPVPLNTGTSKDKVWTYSGSIQYKPDTNSLLYAKIATGYRPGGPQPQGGVAGSTIPDTFDPDTTTNYEAGAKFTAFDRMLTANVSAFYIDWKDIQLTQQAVIVVGGITTRRSYVGNGGKASSRGFDFDLTLRPTQGLTLALAGAYTNARLDQASATLGAVAGERIPYLPRWTMNGAINYSTPIGGDAVLNLGAAARYIGKRTNYFAADPSGNKQAIMPDYTILDLNAGVSLGTWDIDFRINNVTDRRAILSALSNAFASGPTRAISDYAVVAQPRTYAVSVTKRF